MPARSWCCLVISPRTAADVTSSAVIELQAVSKYYDDVLAVDAVSFSIDGGTICALLGGNGAGKTTVLSMLIRNHIFGTKLSGKSSFSSLRFLTVVFPSYLGPQPNREKPKTKPLPTVALVFKKALRFMLAESDIFSIPNGCEGRPFYGLVNSIISSASTNNATHEGINIGIGRIWGFCQ